MSSSRIDRRTFLSVGTVGVVGSAFGLRAALAQDEDKSTPIATPGASPVASPGASPEAAKTDIDMELIDIDFKPKEFTIPAKTDVTLHLKNTGQLEHDFNIDDNKNDSDPDIHSDKLQSGDTQDMTINLDEGDWYFYCNIPGHEEAGMNGTVHVVKKD